MKIFEFLEYRGERSAYVTSDNLDGAIKAYLKDEMKRNDRGTLEDCHVTAIYELELPNNSVVGSMDWTEPEESSFKGKKVWPSGA